MIFVETSNGRNIACDRIIFEIKQTDYLAHLYRDVYEYEILHVSMITKIYDLKEGGIK